MDDSKSRADQLEELLRELREKRLAQTMELEQIKTEYLNDPTKPIQPAETFAREVSNGINYAQTNAAKRAPQPAQPPAGTAQRGPVVPYAPPKSASPTAPPRPVQTAQSSTAAPRPVQGSQSPSAAQRPAQGSQNQTMAQKLAQGMQQGQPVQGQFTAPRQTQQQPPAPQTQQPQWPDLRWAETPQQTSPIPPRTAQTRQTSPAPSVAPQAKSPTQTTAPPSGAQQPKPPMHTAAPQSAAQQPKPQPQPGAPRTTGAAPEAIHNVQSTAQEARQRQMMEQRAQDHDRLNQTQQQQSVGDNRPRPSRRISETMQFELPKERPSFTQFSSTAQMKAIKQAEIDAKKEEAASKSRKNKRSILGNLISEHPNADSIEFDPINKDMLAPSIERGVDAIPETATSVSNTRDILLPEQKKEYTENHPLFSQSITTETIIPAEKRGPAARRAAQAAQNPDLVKTAVLTENAKQNAKKGVLNVRENVDDNFREFFGDTVIIDRESLNEKAKRQRKIKDFVVAENEGEVGGPVFEDEEGSEEFEQMEYRSDEDTEAVAAQLSDDQKKSLISTIVVGVAAFALLILNVMAELDLVTGALTEPLAFYGINLALLLVAVGVCAKAVFAGFVRLVSFRANEDSLVSFASIAAIAECAMLLFGDGLGDLGGACACVAVGALLFNRLGLYLKNKRIFSSFRTVSENYEKYATSVLEEQNFTRRITKDLNINNPQILVKRKTGFTEGFLPHSYSEAEVGRGVSIVASVLFFVSIACGVLGYLRTEDGIVGAVRFMSIAAAFTGPFLSTLAVYLPIYCMQRSLSKVGAVVPGYSAAQEVCDANCVVLEGRELFPKGNVLLHGIKTFERERIDKAILYAASVIVHSCDTMSHMFMNVIQNKTEMLYPVDGVDYEGGLGYSFWIDKTRILLGTRELLRAHEIEVPSRDYESRYTKTNTRDALYLAVSGKLYAMFVISYSPNAEVENALKSFEREGVDILVHTRDFNITADKISKLYRIPSSMVAIVDQDDIAELSRKTEYVGRAPSALTHIGSLSSFVRGIIACYNVRSSVKLATTIELACMVLGAIAAIVLSVMGLITTIGVVSVLFFQIVCCLFMTVAVAVHRY